MTLSRLTGSIAQNNAKLNSEILTLSARANTLLGNISLAEKQIESAVNAKFGPIEEEIAIKRAQRAAIADDVTKNERIQLDALEKADKAKEKEIAEQKQKEKDIQKEVLKAIGNGIIDQNILDRIGSAESVVEAARIAQLNVIGTEDTTVIPVSQTFEEFITNKEQELKQSIADPEKFRAEYNQEVENTQIISDEEPLTINQIDQFRRAYGWTPPLGYSMPQLLQYMADNPSATPEQLTAKAKEEAEKLGIEQPEKTASGEEIITVKVIQGRITNALDEGFSDEQVKTAMKQLFTAEQLFDLAKRAGFSKWYTGKEKDIDRMLDNILKLS